MAEEEISAPLNPNSPAEEPPSKGDSTSEQRRATPPGTKRLLLSLSVLLSFLLALPFLLKSTEIYRSPLPFVSIGSLSAHLQSHPPSLPSRLHAVFLPSPRRPRPSPSHLLTSISKTLNSRPSAANSSFAISVTVDSAAGCDGDTSLWKCGTLGYESGFEGRSDEFVDELLGSAVREGGGGGGRVYTVVVVEREEGEVRVVVGKHRHAWVVGKLVEEDAVELVGEVFVEVFVNGGRVGGEENGEDMPVGLDGSVVFSFSLLNADPSDWVYDWEFQKIEKIMLAPVVKALAPIANISIESQVLYHTPKSAISYWDDKLHSYVFSTRDLPFFVNSNEWHLDTSIAAAGRSKVLQFVVYIPSASECPLLLRLPNGEISKTNGFISPMWGGVVVWNPPMCTGGSQKTYMNRKAIPPQDMQQIFQVFIGQLRLLFGFKSDNSHLSKLAVFNFLPSERGFTDWELDVLYRHHACSNLLSCVTTLESLSKLVQSLPRMIVKDEIGKQVKLSLEAASLAQNNASLGVYDASAVSSRKARALAEDAFFHPSIMSISYSSIEHYFAIYMPFFAPVSLHVLLAAIKEAKRYRKERAKYLAFVADKSKAS